ncbi:MAG TPA: 4-hydroxy-tetrahydrodipicolinate synthase [Stellaceae bacterium]|nr:4-hydroxy-tetrahydrodipicolinate synthase [Stellaceae bacterium]
MEPATASLTTSLETPAGIWLPLVTPFIEGALDEASLARLARHYGMQEIAGLILAATTGEGLVLDDHETARVVETVAAALPARKAVYLGLCGSDTHKLVRRLDATRHWPIDGYLITCPYYTRPSQAGLYQHFRALAQATERPIMIYNIPYRTGVNLGNETMLRLAEVPNIVGVKDCCADPAQSFDLLRLRPSGFAVLTGEDALFHGAIAQGADGGVLATAHTDPAAFAAVRDALAAAKTETALALWRGLIDLVRLLFAEPNPAPIKHWLWRMGLIASPELRLPMTGITPSLAGQLDRLLWARRSAA